MALASRSEEAALRKRERDKARRSTEEYKAAAREKARAWRKANPEKMRAQNQSYWARNREKMLAQNKEWREQNPEKVKAYGEKWRQKPSAKLKIRIATRMRECIRNGWESKTIKEKLGWSVAELRAHLERQFLKGMSWENMGQWHIDHVIPLSSFNFDGSLEDPELVRAWALPNLRPIWADENMRKGSKLEFLL